MIDLEKIILESIEVKNKIIEKCMVSINKSNHILKKAIKNGNKIIWCGNGGSAADAQHMAAELMGGLVSHDRKPIPSIALTTDTSFITAWSNDTSYESIFSRQVEGLGNPGDVLIAISTSGNSVNIINAINSAVKKNIKIIILTGQTGGLMSGLGNVKICVPSKNTQRIQEGHLLIEHLLCESLESWFLNMHLDSK